VLETLARRIEDALEGMNARGKRKAKGKRGK
jgi:hypothetical protein